MVYFFAKRFLMIINYDLCFDINFIVDLLLFLLVCNGMWSGLPACNAIVRVYCRFFEKVLKIKLLYEVTNIDLSIKYGSKIMIQVRIWLLTNYVNVIFGEVETGLVMVIKVSLLF